MSEQPNFFDTFYWPSDFVNGEEEKHSDLVTFIWCVPEVVLMKEMGKFGLDYGSGMHEVCKRLFIGNRESVPSLWMGQLQKEKFSETTKITLRKNRDLILPLAKFVVSIHTKRLNAFLSRMPQGLLIPF